jgi:hypothetical protein
MSFQEVAQLHGHGETLLAQGEEVCTYRMLAPDEIMRVVSRASTEQRARRKQTFFHPAIAARRRLGQGFHDRAEAYLFAAGDLDERDRAFILKQMPMPARIVSVAHKIVCAGDTWDVSVRAQHFGLSNKQDCFSIVNVGTLQLESGARVIVRGNILSLACDLVVSDGGSIEIHPTPYSPDEGSGPHNGAAGACGRQGHRGAHGAPLDLQSSFLGPVVREGFDLSTLNGAPGENGTAGNPGAPGRNGGMCKLAEITLHRIEGLLTLFVQAGSGGDGGAGGAGGAGGEGGAGQSGCATVGGVIRGGRGGDGGSGAPGGRGGNAGHGGVASNIYINLPEEDCQRLRCVSLASRPGNGRYRRPRRSRRRFWQQPRRCTRSHKRSGRARKQWHRRQGGS